VGLGLLIGRHTGIEGRSITVVIADHGQAPMAFTSGLCPVWRQLSPADGSGREAIVWRQAGTKSS
jgi:hypothetical protein